MAYKSYVSEAYYTDCYEGSVMPEGSAEKALLQASRHIDSLTYNRIVSQGFSNLTEFQQEIIKEVVCKQAEFEYENRGMYLQTRVLQCVKTCIRCYVRQVYAVDLRGD